MALLEVRDLRTQFTTRAGALRAVDGVSFELEVGETLGLVGESGCGKSVTALSLMRLIPSNETISGEVVFDGVDVLSMSPDALRRIRGRHMALIFQDPMTTLNPLISVGEQIAEGLRLHLKMGRADSRKRAIQLLEHVGIPGAERRAGDFPHQFSGGMRQRVGIAMAIACNPKLVIADEITTALDVTIQAQILELLKSLTSELGTAFLFITHDLGVVAGMTQRVHVMYAGRIVEKATTRDLFRDPKMPYTWGLLRSVPRLDSPTGQPLVPIEGAPPSLTAPMSGCRFEPRCPYRRAICRTAEPELTQVPGAAPGHEVRCWGAQEGPDTGWLRGIDWRVASGDPSALSEIRTEWSETVAPGATVES